MIMAIYMYIQNDPSSLNNTILIHLALKDDGILSVLHLATERPLSRVMIELNIRLPAGRTYLI